MHGDQSDSILNDGISVSYPYMYSIAIFETTDAISASAPKKRSFVPKFSAMPSARATELRGIRPVWN